MFLPRGQEKERTQPAILWWSQKPLQENKSYNWSKSASAGNYQKKQHKVYRSTSLPNETIFSIHRVGLTKHHVFKVYQTLSHPRRLEGVLNHFIYWVLEYADIQSLSTVQTKKTEHQAGCAFLERVYLYKKFNLHLQGSKNHQVSCLFVYIKFHFNGQICREGLSCLWKAGWILH